MLSGTMIGPQLPPYNTDIIELCKTFNFEETYVVGKLKSLSNTETEIKCNYIEEDTDSTGETKFRPGSWFIVNNIKDTIIECKQVSNKTFLIPIWRLEIPESWVYKECREHNDNFTEHSLYCRNCGAPPYGNNPTRRVLLPPGVSDSSILLQILGGIINPDPEGDNAVHQLFLRSQQEGTPKPEEEPIPEDQLPNEGDIVCTLCCERKATMFLSCCKSEGEDKNLCKSCLRNLYTKTETNKCPYCRREIDFETFKTKESPQGSIYREEDL